MTVGAGTVQDAATPLEAVAGSGPVGERDWDPCSKDGWFAMVQAPARSRPSSRTVEQITGMPRRERLGYDHARAVWHANLGPIATPGVAAVFAELDEICGSNRQDGEKVRPAAVLDALPGLGKTTAAMAFGRRFHRDQIELFGPTVAAGRGAWQRIPVVYLGLTSNTTMRSLNSMLCRFFALPGAHRGTADVLAHRAAEAVSAAKTRLIIVDDVHFLDVTRRDGREVANHFKWLANTFPVTFLFVGVGLRARGLLDEGLSGADAAFSQTARRWNVLTLAPFEVATPTGRETWRSLLLGIERDLVLASSHRGMVTEQLSDYLFARSSGHFASLMSLITRGCYRAITTGVEALTVDLLDGIRIDQAAETARTELLAAFDTGLATTRTSQPRPRPRSRRTTPAAGRPAGEGAA